MESRKLPAQGNPQRQSADPIRRWGEAFRWPDAQRLGSFAGLRPFFPLDFALKHSREWIQSFQAVLHVDAEGGTQKRPTRTNETTILNGIDRLDQQPHSLIPYEA
ncbi:hypothetical protein [Paenibacillus alba]|uniref:Uncharacterized protein n=1 Tax=Paenibacillus alba TaxID=1197127 RepID=A0ABU6GEM2_9BACL|nr:hypothetical protein [Paenibacillus alba]MEC0232671.1 hypothetical protein [Paenibacillus alba]